MGRRIIDTEPPQSPRRSRRVTMADVAREVGCSQATVSLVLNRNETIRISAQLRERVFTAARSLHYAPLSHAPALQPGKGPIGFVIDHLAASPAALAAIEGAQQAAWSDARVILVAETHGDPQMERMTLDTLKGHSISALIFMTCDTREIALPDGVSDLDIPVVLLNCTSADHRYPAAVPSDIAGGQMMTAHLIARGHRRIATITSEPAASATQDRLAGYRRALATADLPFDPDLVVSSDGSASSGYDATISLIALRHRPTAIFCQNDRMALGCYEALKERGLRIPEDMSVVGCDDDEVSRHLHPRLTTSLQPQHAMGQWALEQIEAYQPRRDNYPVTKLEYILVERDSVTPRLVDG